MGDDNAMNTATLPTRDSVTRSQLDTLHSIIQNLGPYLLGPRRMMFEEFENLPPKIDGGVAASASVTFINACARIDAILSDPSRWALEAHDKLYASVEDVQKAQVEYLNTETRVASAMLRPSAQFKPVIANDGAQFVAYYGDITRSGYAIIGLGQTPSEALLSFDRAFEKTPQEQIIMATESATKPTPSKKRKAE
jgi:hypothetical protein